jgi:hypothetical protein
MATPVYLTRCDCPLLYYRSPAESCSVSATVHLIIFLCKQERRCCLVVVRERLVSELKLRKVR